ncbi:MAG: SRPBCC family protein [Gammaproteobacteria bacterium]|nr:SRPBCC family protein [Gammaproteobacteria bacterium]NKC11672.1 SRPBCC family protein [Gammaproteobacteria bacterium]
MIKVERSTVVMAPLTRVWAVLRDFNGHGHWHPAVTTSRIERAQAADRVGCVRRFVLGDGAELREQLLALSDRDHAFTYCLLDTPVPLINYVAHVRLAPVTDSDATFWHWASSFITPPGRERELRTLVGEDIYQAGFDAIKRHLAATGVSP